MRRYLRLRQNLPPSLLSGDSQYLQVKPYSSVAKRLAAKAIEAAVVVMDHPTDSINVAVETLVKEAISCLLLAL